MAYRKGSNHEELRKVAKWRSTCGARGVRSLIGMWYAENHKMRPGIDKVGSALEIYHRNHKEIRKELFPEEDKEGPEEDKEGNECR